MNICNGVSIPYTNHLNWDFFRFALTKKKQKTSLSLYTDLNFAVSLPLTLSHSCVFNSVIVSFISCLFCFNSTKGRVQTFRITFWCCFVSLVFVLYYCYYFTFYLFELEPISDWYFYFFICLCHNIHCLSCAKIGVVFVSFQKRENYNCFTFSFVCLLFSVRFFFFCFGYALVSPCHLILCRHVVSMFLFFSSNSLLSLPSFNLVHNL